MAITMIELTGGPRERGRRHGALLKREIGRLWSGWVASAARQEPSITERELLAFTGAHRYAAGEFSGELVAEVQGIGEGSGIGADRAFALSCWDELCSWFACRGGPRGGGCTSFAVRRPAGFVIGQNQDAWTWWRPVVVTRHHEPGGASPPVLVATHPGVLGVLGLNGNGLGIVANSLLPSDRDVGVPFTFVLRAALGSETVGEAAGMIAAAPRATGANWVIASADEAVDLETTRDRACLTTVADTCGHSNHYLADELTDLECGIDGLPDTVLRAQRMGALLHDSGDDRRVETLLEHLSDHQGHPTAICRHPARTSEEMETLAATVLVPGENLMIVTDGPPCANDPEGFRVEVSRCDTACERTDA